MEYNANKVCEELVSRVKGAPGPGGFLKAYAADKANELFFNDQKYLLQYHLSNAKERLQTPGYHYYHKVKSFIDLHCKIGMKYMEYLRFGCQLSSGATCDFWSLNNWKVAPVMRVPQPYPDYRRHPEFHYKHVDTTPNNIEGIQRPVDDFNPRKQLKQMFESGSIHLSKTDAIEKFCKRFIIPEDKVLAALSHLHVLKVKKDKKQEAKKQKDQSVRKMLYDEKDWENHLENNTLSKLPVHCLNVYLLHHKLESLLKLKKKEKSQKILHHIAFHKPKPTTGLKGNV